MDVMFYPAFVCLSVTSRKNYRPDLHESFTINFDEMISLNFFSNSQFDIHITGISDRIFMQIVSDMYLWTSALD